MTVVQSTLPERALGVTGTALQEGVPPNGRPETIAAAFAPPGTKDAWLRGTEVVELMATVLFEAEKWPLDNT
ncbi:hypothetical protein ACFYZB_10875 [Streptomyces sp. NPDC001852]|uniref:hypothetical protein n=1 Tax=Streptomyces sp. NPDC001852 TaxID=3364619 RepID=UPI00369A78A4